ncbi:MAG TPA: FtsQ-type POTRA domain-containing protein, partial [Candidatus Limnocylindrales bacterium]
APTRPAGRRGPGAPPARRTRSIRRASAGLSPVRAGAILAMLLSASAVYGVANSPAFAYLNTTVEGVELTDEAAVRATLEDAQGANLFELVTAPYAERIREIPTVRSVDLSVRLPDTIAVRLRERTPILIWRIGERRYLVDAEGQLFTRLPEVPPDSAKGLPVVEDRRAASVGLSVGRSLDRVDLDAATRLGSLVPGDVGSAAERLVVFVTDANGFMVRTNPASWQAVFGFYTPTLRTPELIPGQVRLLRSLLIGREPLVERIILASETDGTYIPKPTPSPGDGPGATTAP